MCLLLLIYTVNMCRPFHEILTRALSIVYANPRLEGCDAQFENLEISSKSVVFFVYISKH